MRFVVISDTHSLHDGLTLPEGDVLVHAGDATERGTLEEVSSFGNWFARQNYDYRIIIAGNHDFLFESDEKAARLALDETGSKIIYLCDEYFCLNSKGKRIKIWGAPWQPWFHSWAFNARNHKLKEVWQLIPEDVDILMTHGPAHGVLDTIYSGEHVGCSHLRERILHCSPKVHICGHIHESYGTSMLGDTLMLNASICDLRYQPIRKPIVFDWKDGQVELCAD